MVNFIEKHHKNDEKIFWPDLTSCYYAKKTLEWLEQKNIKIVLKADNPQNGLHARLIESF
jgi:arsenate reductase-like glutaredoxin family protein